MKISNRLFFLPILLLLLLNIGVFGYLILNALIWTYPLNHWHLFGFSLFAIISVIILFALVYWGVEYKEQQLKSVNAFDLNTLKQVIDAQDSILIAFDSDKRIIWTNNNEFFVNFCGVKDCFRVFLKQFLPANLIQQLQTETRITNYPLQLKHKLNKKPYLFRLSLVQTSILLLQSQQLVFELEEWIKDHRVVFFLFQVDFDDVTGIFNALDKTVQRNQILVFIEIKLNEILKEYKFLLNTPKENFFILTFDAKTFKQLQQTKFNFLDQLRQLIKSQFRFDLTFSAGVYYSQEEVFADKTKHLFHNYQIVDAYKESLLAFEMALKRAGDQIIITRPNKKFRVWGYQKSRIRLATSLKNKYAQFMKYIGKYKNIFIVGHKVADLDVYGAGIALKILLQNVLPQTTVKFVVSKPEPKTQELVSQLLDKKDYDDYIYHLKTEDREKFDHQQTALIIVDTNQVKKVNLPPNQLKLFQNVFIVDHHTNNFTFPNAKFHFINNNFSSASEIITLFLMINENNSDDSVALPNKVLQLLLMGILLDTNNLQNNLGDQTFSTINYLNQKGAKVETVLQLMTQMKSTILPRKIETLIVAPQKIVVKVFDKQANAVSAANLAEEFLTKQGVAVVFVVLFNHNKNVFVSARSKIDFNIEVVCKALGGGGDSKRAAAQLTDVKFSVVIEKISTKIKELTAT